MKKTASLKALKIRVSDAPYQKLSAARRKRWSAIIKAFGYGFSDPFIIFLAETLAILSGSKAEFSGTCENNGYSTGEEYWSINSGGMEIFRARKRTMSDGWQRVETEEDRTTLSGFSPQRCLEWDGDYDNTFGMQLKLVGITSEEERQLSVIAHELFKKVEFSR